MDRSRQTRSTKSVSYCEAGRSESGCECPIMVARTDCTIPFAEASSAPQPNPGPQSHGRFDDDKDQPNGNGGQQSVCGP